MLGALKGKGIEMTLYRLHQHRGNDLLGLKGTSSTRGGRGGGGRDVLQSKSASAAITCLNPLKTHLVVLT